MAYGIIAPNKLKACKMSLTKTSLNETPLSKLAWWSALRLEWSGCLSKSKLSQLLYNASHYEDC